MRRIAGPYAARKSIIGGTHHKHGSGAWWQRPIVSDQRLALSERASH